MKHLKMLGLLVMAAASLMAFASSASAATFTSPTGTAYTGAVTASLEAGSTALLRAGFAELTCTTGTVAGNVTTNNEEHATGPTTSVSFGSATTPCTGPQGAPKVTTNSSVGTLTIKKGTHVVTGTGVDVTNEVLGISCTYGMGTGTTLGTATNTTVGGVDRVTLAINAKLPGTPENGFFCGNPATWTANYVVTSPSPSFVD
jgi:hypothetical protein